jgi:pimeloyl-ACP methyl ester carboxylesterase
VGCNQEAPVTGSVCRINAAICYLACRQTSLRVCRLPAQPRPDKPLALFLFDCFADLDRDGHCTTGLAGLFDLILCELPGHGETGHVADVSLDGFAREYASLLDCHVPGPCSVTVIGEGFGGLVALALAQLRPDRVEQVILLDPPFHLTRVNHAASLSNAWRRAGTAYQARILEEIFGIDPPTGTRLIETPLHHLVADLSQDCILIAGSEASGDNVRLPSLVTAEDLARLRRLNPDLRFASRIRSAGHRVLAENQADCISALERLLPVDVVPALVTLSRAGAAALPMS